MTYWTVTTIKTQASQADFCINIARANHGVCSVLGAVLSTPADLVSRQPSTGQRLRQQHTSTKQSGQQTRHGEIVLDKSSLARVPRPASYVLISHRMTSDLP